MKEKGRSFARNIAVTVLILGVAFAVCLLLQYGFSVHEYVTAIFVLAVFLISDLTRRYIYGILASLASMLIVNYAFTEPFFWFDFIKPENLISAVVMVAISVFTCTLVSKLKKQEEAAAEHERERMRANLLRAVSHDLRTPLTTIYGSSAALIEDRAKLSEEQQLKMLRGIEEDSQWLIRIVENLLSITKIDSGNVKLNKVPTVLEELVDSATVKFQNRYPEQELILDIPEQFVTIPMDALLIEQVLINLLENAVHHAVGMTHLWLRAVVQGGQAVFAVEDDGCGIPPEQKAKLFRGGGGSQDGPADSRKRNAGIGLSVCADIIKAHGGNLWVEDREGGAQFLFVLDAGEEETDEQQ